MACQNANEQCRVRDYTVEKSREKECYLDPNHTHFLLFDDGDTLPQNVFERRAEIEMRSRDHEKARPSHVMQVSRIRSQKNVFPLSRTTTPSNLNAEREKNAQPAADTLIPIVMVLIEGGGTAIKIINEALNAKTPVVVIKVRKLHEEE